jgi:ParB family chromosome partitioning protein
MSSTPREAELKLIPIDAIEVLNPRDRNNRVFEEIVENIKAVGLKKPITVTTRMGLNGEERYLLVCGEGRMKALKALGETSIPAMIVNVNDDDAFIMSLAENIARRNCRAVELLAGIQRLQDQGYDKPTIAAKTGLSTDYIQGILQLLGNQEDRLLTAVEAGKIPLYVALAINRAGNDDKEIQSALQEAYESGKLKGRQLINAKRLIEKRQALGKSLGYRVKTKRYAGITSSSLIRSYQREVERQKLLVKKSDLTQQKLMFVIGALRNLFIDENFSTLLRAEGLDTLPTFLAERVWPQGSPS